MRQQKRTPHAPPSSLIKPGVEPPDEASLALQEQAQALELVSIL